MASRFEALGMNLSLISVLKLFFIFFSIGEHFITATKLFSYKHQQALNIVVITFHHLSKHEIQMFTFIQLNFE